jgi:hypothetical protein
MASLPILHRRRQSKAAQTVETVVKAWTALNVASAGSTAAKKGAKAYGVAKGAKVVGRPVLKLAAVPAALGGGALAFRSLRKRSASGAPATTPVAHASTVSPPIDDPSGSLTDPPAGAVNPPVGPRAAT